jgi:hypothetical protein
MFSRGMVSAAFSVFGLFVFAVAGLLVFSVWPIPVKVQTQPLTKGVPDKPSFHLTASDLGRLRPTGQVMTLGATGRVEARQYGRLYDRDTDLTVAIVMPPNGQLPQENLATEMARLRWLKLFSPVNSWTMQRYYDLETRFGMFRAVDMQVNVDGLTKLCLGFVSRFDLSDAYLAGWTCSANGAHPEPYDLACKLDHIVFDARLPSEAADAFFRSGQARASTCSAVPVSQTSDTRASIPRPRIPQAPFASAIR